MTTDDLIQSFRDYADDLSDPPLWSDVLVNSYADQAEIEACNRRPLLTSSTDTALCVIDVVTGTSKYVKHVAVREVYYAKLTTPTEVFRLRITNIDELNFLEPNWEDLLDVPKYLLLDDSTVEIVPTPTENGVLEISVSHVPIINMSVSGNPTINEAHHYNLVYWMLHLGYEKHDADTFNAKKSLDYYTRFANYFGEPKNTNALKSVRNVRNDRYQGSWI